MNDSRFEDCHPGAYVRDAMRERGWDARILSAESGINVLEIEGLLAGRVKVDHDIALGLAVAFGTTARAWMNLQRLFDLTGDLSAG